MGPTTSALTSGWTITKSPRCFSISATLLEIFKMGSMVLTTGPVPEPPNDRRAPSPLSLLCVIIVAATTIATALAVGPSQILSIPTQAPQSRAPQTPHCEASCDGACDEMLTFILEKRAAASWERYYDEVADALLSIGLGRNNSSRECVVEVGTAFGGLANRLLERLPVHTVLHAVDPFLPYDPGDQMSHLLERINEAHASSAGGSGSELWARALRYNLGSKFGTRYCLHHGRSEEEAADFPTAACDVVSAVFIDGDHTEKGVRTDLKAWSRIVKPGGLLIFNDYGYRHFPGVQAVVDAFAQATHQPIKHIGPPEHMNVVLTNI